MASPVPDSYSGASGGVIAGGRFVAPSIVGSTWTPSKDGSGNVLTGNWQGLPLNTWLFADVPLMSSVIAQPPYAGTTGEDAILNAWNGAAWDYANQKMYFGGGGHNDTSACETGVYCFDAAKLEFSRPHDRAALSQLQTWNPNTYAIDVGVDWHNAGNTPLLNGEPSAIHTYHGLIWIPPAIVGNVKGGVWYPGNANAMLNLDTDTWTTCHFNRPNIDFLSWSNCTAFLDADTLYFQDNNYYHATMRLNTTQATEYSATSYGTYTERATSHGTVTSGSGLWAWLRERREEVSFTQTAGFTRMRYGQAIDASATNWSSYLDTITLTSSDGSHADFNTTNLSQGSETTDGFLTSAGAVYDPATSAMYVQGNTVGSQLYKITGLSGNTWTTEKIAGTGALANAVRGTYGRMRLATLGGKKILIRVSGVRTPPQVMRLN